MQISNKYVAIKLGDFCTLANKVGWGGKSICKHFKLIEYNPKLRLFVWRHFWEAKHSQSNWVRNLFLPFLMATGQSKCPEQLTVGVLQENAWLWTLHSCMEPNITTSFDTKCLIFASRVSSVQTAHDQTILHYET